jgi:hypothetical protein
MSGNQSSNLSAGNHIEFDTVVGNISVSTGSGQANGLITLNKNKKYVANLSTWLIFSSTNSTFRLAPFITGGSQITNSVQLRIHPVTYNVANYSSVPITRFNYTPSIQEQIELQIIQNVNCTQIQSDNTCLLIETPGLSKENTFIRYK